MEKRAVFGENVGKERDVFFIKEDRNYLIKRASQYHPEIQKYIDNATPIKDLVQVLITALGAYEQWGINANADAFPEAALSHKGDDFGYETFKTNANYFLHHVNKDPSLAKGKVLHTVWNQKAKRVELVIGIDVNLDPEGVSSVANGEALAFSMGSRLPYDVCSICGNKAKTRAEYCDHLKYQLRQMDPVTGKLVYANNTLPKFFDISRVLIPADKTAYMWTKVAAAAGDNPFAKLGSAELAALPPGKINDLSYLRKIATDREALNKEAVKKSAAVSKSAYIKKQIPVQVPAPKVVCKLEEIIPIAKLALEANSPNIDINVFRGHSLPEAMVTLLAMGIVPKRDEMTGMHELFVAHKPSVLDNLTTGIDNFSRKLADKLVPYVEERSFSKPILLKRLMKTAALPSTKLRALVNPSSSKLDKLAEGSTAHAGLAAAIAAALYAMMSGGAEKRSAGMGRLIADHPFIAMALGAGMIKTLRNLNPSRQVESGQITLADPTRGLYNNDWQSRFRDLQTRPVAVIKTGSVSVTTASQLIDGMSLLFQHANLNKLAQSQHPVTDFILQNPSKFELGLIGAYADGQNVSEKIGSMMASASRLIKSASLGNLEFLEMLPDTDRDVVWDLAIINAADEINRKIVEGGSYGNS